MLKTLADFLLGAALTGRDDAFRSAMRTPSRPRGDYARHEDLGWMARVGTW